MEQIKSGLDALKAAVEQKLTVEDYNQIDGGYELLMSDGSKIYIYNGADGAKGDKGDQGEKGDTGAQGPQGEKGEDGDAFFQIVGAPAGGDDPLAKFAGTWTETFTNTYMKYNPADYESCTNDAVTVSVVDGKPLQQLCSELCSYKQYLTQQETRTVFLSGT